MGTKHIEEKKEQCDPSMNDICKEQTMGEMIDHTNEIKQRKGPRKCNPTLFFISVDKCCNWLIR